MPEADVAALVASARRHALGDILHRTARRLPSRTAVVDGEVRLTYAELDEVVDRVAGALQAEGLGKGDRLALLSHNCWQYVVLVYATARVGVVLVPVNFMLGSTEIRFILEHSGAAAFVTEAGLAGTAGGAVAGLADPPQIRAAICLDGQPLPEGWADLAGWIEHAGGATDVAMADDDPVRLMYTSGTEALPKGALLSSRSLLWEYTACVIDGGMAPDDIDVHALPLYHCAQLDVFLGPDIYLGATSVILRGPDPVAMLRAVEAEAATKLFCPPTVWISLLRCEDFERTDLSSLRKGYFGASPMPPEVLREIARRLPAVRLWNLYGQTELAPLATLLPPDEQLEHPGAVGYPVINVETQVVDEDDRPVPAGTVGEIVHRSPHATLGYYRQPEKTAEAFRHGWFHSGDLGRLDEDGRLWVVDRKKDMIKTGGENVASREVEDAIFAFAPVAEVAVFGVDHPVWVEAVVAAVVAKAGEDLDPEAVGAHCATVLAGYKRPKHIAVVDELPKNPSGKILKRVLRDRFAGLWSD